MSTFPKVLDSPDILEIFTMLWHDDVMSKMKPADKQSISLLQDKSTEMLQKVYPVLFSDAFGWTPQNATQSVRGDKVKYETRKKLLVSALRFGTNQFNKDKLKKVEEMTTFKPFNIREIEFEVWDTMDARRDNILRQYE